MVINSVKYLKGGFILFPYITLPTIILLFAISAVITSFIQQYLFLDLVSYKDGGRTLIKPKHKRHVTLFEHCAGGMTAVTPEFFNMRVKKLLKMHGNKYFINIEEEKSNVSSSNSSNSSN